MIKNNGQYKRTLAKLDEMQLQRKVLLEEGENQSAKFKFALSSFDAIISDFKGGLQIIQPTCLEELPKAVIQARIAMGFTQKEFAEKVSLKEQQIQRYESEDYQGVSFDRLLEFVEVLGLKFYFEKTFIQTSNTDIFSYGDNITEEKVIEASQKVKKRGSLLIP
jgi:HTH-type transcriptional regulator/antitoxin HipB